METHKPLLTVQDLATYLDVPVATIYAWRHRHEGPPRFRVGRHARFRWNDVTMDGYGHLFPSDMEALAADLNAARSRAHADQLRAKDGPEVVELGAR